MLTVTEATSSLPKKVARKYGKIGGLLAIPDTRQNFHGDPGTLLRPHPLEGLKQEEFWVALGVKNSCIQGHPGQVPIFRSNLKCLVLSGTQQGNEQ